MEERGTYAFQPDSAAFHLAVFATKPWLSGALYFALQDFAVTPGWTGGNPYPDPPFLHKGLVDLVGDRQTRVWHRGQDLPRDALRSPRRNGGEGRRDPPKLRLASEA